MRAKARRDFLPSRLDGIKLEERLVLSRAGLAAPALILNPVRQSAYALRHLSPQQRVNQAFDHFTTDYLQAQQIFFQSTGLSNAQTTFENYLNQRVSLLTQALIHAMARLPGASSKLRPNQRITQSMSTTLQSFLYRKIDGDVAPGGTTGYGNVSLLTALKTDLPTVEAGGTTISPTAAALYSLKASNAIEAARLNTINAAYLMSGGPYLRHK